MVSSVLSGLVCVLCVILIPAVWADYCNSYWDSDGLYHDSQQCGSSYCCGDCNKKYCCREEENRLTQENLEDCDARFSYLKKTQVAPILGGVFAAVLPVVICVILIICCVSPCCWCYKKCRKGRRRQQIVINTTNVVSAPQQPVSPSAYQPSYPGYQLVPVPHGYGGSHIPTAPPSYLEAIDSPYSSAAFHQGQPMYPLQPPGPPYAPPHSDELVQLPYNPSYNP